MGSRLEANSTAVRKRIENHNFEDEGGEEYEPSKFGGFPEYFRRKKIKLQNLDAQIRSESTDKPQIFQGIVAHVNGYTQPSLNDLHVLIITHGGGFIQYLDGKTQATHIIASNLTPKKVEEFRKYRIVKPAWIVDSVNAAKVLPWENYRVVDEGTKQKVLKFDEGNITSQVNRKPVGYRDQTAASWYTRQLAEEQESQTNHAPDDSIDTYDFPSSPVLSEDGSQDYKPAHADTTNASSPIRRGEPHNTTDSQRSQPTLSSSYDRNTTAAASGPTGVNDNTTAKILDKDVQLPDTAQDPEDAIEPKTGIEARGNVSMATSFETPLKRKTSEQSLQPDKRAKLTAEDHNRELLADPRIRQSSVVNPDFLDQYYRESRLHHLSTWKAELKAQMQALAAAKTVSQKANQKRPPSARRYILHVDFDSFFVAVSLKKYPQYQDKPAVVAHGAGSGSEIASCNYAARQYGVKNGMWMKRAQEMYDDLKVLPYDFPEYEAASRLFYEALISSGGLIQSVSIDEALVDVSVQCHAAGGTDGTGVREGSIWREQAKADEMAQALRDQVKRESGCAVSVGIGGNILLAKVALRKAKPAGQFQIKPEGVLDFLGDLEVQSLPGVAYSIGGKLEEIGVKLVKDIRDLNRERLTSVLGPKTGEKIWNYSRGIDRTEVGDQVVRKSVSAEVNWGVRFETPEQVDEFMASLSGELSRRLLKEGVKGRNLTMKVMRRSKDAPLDPPKHLGHGKCDIFNKSITLGILTNDKDVINKEFMSILRGFGFSPGELRGLGIQMTKLEPIKADAAGIQDGSQRRLQFNTAPARPRKPDTPEVPPPLTPKDTSATNEPAASAGKKAAPVQEPAKPSSQFKIIANEPEQMAQPPLADDIQDDPETSRRPKQQHIGGVPQTDSPSRKPLNISGTQFIMPTQVDPKVLAELPAEVRAKLQKHVPQPRKQPGVNATKKGQPESPGRPAFAFTALPNESQIDPAILDALPEDVRNEILSQYQKSPSKPGPHRGQAILPQSPRKNRTVKNNVPTRGKSRGRPRGGSLLARLKGAASRDNSTLTQANFVAAYRDHDGESGAGDIAADFLEALPEDVRAEVVENHKREQLKRKAGIEISRRRRNLYSRREVKRDPRDYMNGERIIRLESRRSKATFTQQKLTELHDLREAISSWHEEFLEDGPYEEDAEALCKFLKSVVADEGNMRKAVEVVKWLDHVVASAFADLIPSMEADQLYPTTGSGWRKTVEEVKLAVNEAIRSRGLGVPDYET